MPLHVRITKLTALPEGAVDPLGNRGAGPIQPGHTVRGFIDLMPEIGLPVVMHREESNGVIKPGIFTTSPVTEWLGNGLMRFKTLNSTYEIEILPGSIPA